ncbi:ABC transporter ATP-binding protein [Phormidium sp. CLA17]|uniref:ABC transporter ATP-binding protein n=1 Tax=Leptolyngbya sp. Cla-17 TaxID=2803751 RepID=UPI001491BFA0|nr:ABC transporter ATP-binding protein [Leptolyngbya sp. Cla-17]MBM0742181.1 ABC transporter ATP-binding protein [Leptolyngbya sp. Cla-17]
MAQVVLETIYKSFQKKAKESESAAVPEQTSLRQSAAVLRNINLTVNDREFMVLVGPSGCGKSTLLRLIAGLEDLTGGNIYIGDRLVNDLPPKDRDIAMVFQNYALYPHMTVYDNLAFGLRRASRKYGVQGAGYKVQDTEFKTPNSVRVASPNFELQTPNSKLPLWLENLLIETTRKLPKGLRYQPQREKEIDQQVRSIAQILQIDGLLDRLPKQLSGGQKQRVALGRAMARDPQVFLMDEPLSNLDAKLRAETRSQIVKLQRQLGTTTIYVTHDQTEAMTMGDRIAVMNAGQIQQIASPLELYNHPANRFVAEFIGSPPMNFLPIQVKAPLLISQDPFRLTLPAVWEAALKRYDGQEILLGIRPEHLSVGMPAPKNLQVRVELVEALGSETYLTVRWLDAPTKHPMSLQARIEPDHSVQVGDDVWLAIAQDKIHLFDPSTGLAIAQKP